MPHHGVHAAGWHLDTVHPQLLKHAEVLLPAGDGDGGFGHRVWVPLCGKSVDVTWLAVSGHRVLGVELSGMAIDQLFEQFRLPRTTWQPPAPRGIHRVHTCGNIGVVEVHASPYLAALGGPPSQASLRLRFCLSARERQSWSPPHLSHNTGDRGSRCLSPKWPQPTRTCATPWWYPCQS